jgi:predicted helicase
VTKKKEDNTKTFDKYHLIPSEYSLFMTATLKNINKGTYNETDYIFNMDDKDKYGCIIDEKTINWAIDNKKITDYKIVCINNNDDYINNLLNKINIECNNFHKYNKELVMSAYCALKAINDNLVSHILLYTNKRQSAFNIRKIIDNLINMNLFDNINKSIINDSSCFYNKELYSDNKFYHDYKTVKNCNICNTLQTNTCDNINHKTSIDCKNNIKKCIYICKNNKLQIFHNDNEAQDCEICKFKKAKYGIISCVYIFGEGFDLPCLNGVVICEQMTSEIRIVQSCLRPNRLNINDPDKLAYIIIPENIDNINDKNDKLFSVIKEMSMSDNTIEQKINIIDINNNNDNICYVIDNKIKLKQNKNLLNKVLLEAYDRKYFGESLHLKKQYELYKRLINGTYSTVKEYKDCNYKVIENPDIYFGKYWENNWFTFLGIDTSKWIPTLTEWRQHCKQKNIQNINDYKNNMDDLMPPEPDHFYKGFRNFEIELNITTHDFYY